MHIFNCAVLNKQFNLNNSIKKYPKTSVYIYLSWNKNLQQLKCPQGDTVKQQTCPGVYIYLEVSGSVQASFSIAMLLG